MFRLRTLLLAIWAACTVVFLTGAPALAQLALGNDLFGPSPVLSTGRIEPPLYTTRFSAVSVNVDLLREAKPGTRLNLNLFPDVAFAGTVGEQRTRGNGALTVTGTLDGQPNGSFIVVVESDVAAATISVPSLPRVYQLRYRGNGEHLICDMDPELYPPCMGSEPPSDTSAQSNTMDNDIIGQESMAEPAVCSPLTPVFDILVLYTPLARQRAGGTNAINALCQLAIEESNQAYRDSQIGARMRLVYRGEINYTEGGGYGDYLSWVSGNSTVHTLRDTYGADFVSLLVDDSSYCGYGQCYDGSYTTCAWHCATGYYSFSHEIGHNQGCDHDRENHGASGCSVYAYSYGWRFDGVSGTQWRTIMSYSPGTRIQYFSNPYILFDGVATGVAVGETNQSFNALTINNKASVGEDHRVSRFDVWLDFNFGGIQVGTYNYPFTTVASGLNLIDDGIGASELPTLRIKTGSTAETAILNKRMIVRPCGGSAVIGRAVATQ